MQYSRFGSAMSIFKTPEAWLILPSLPSLILNLEVRVEQGMRSGDEVELYDSYILFFLVRR